MIATAIDVNDAVTWMTWVMGGVGTGALLTLLAAFIPAPSRPGRDPEQVDGHLLVYIDPPIGSIPIVKSDVVIDLEARARRTQRAGEAQTRRREGLRRHLNALLSAADEVRQQLRANGEALTQPTPILDEQPTGGER